MASAAAAHTAAQAPAHAPSGAAGSPHTALEMWAALQSQEGSQAGDAPATAEGGPGSHVQAKAPLLAAL